MRMKQAIIEVTIAQGEGDGFKPWGGVRIKMECGHTKQWDGGFPVPVPRVEDQFECRECP